MLFKIAIAVISSIACVSALGINCEGSAYCSGVLGNSVANDEPLLTMVDIIDHRIDDSQWYESGRHIACGQASGICAFVQKASGAWGSDIARAVRDLANHGCTVCGSVPLDFPNTNDINNGEVTFAFVGWDNMGRCNGLC